MNESVQLLSTMSPRVKVKNNFKRKGPTFLALRQSLKRRSSNFFKKPLRIIKEDAIIKESSTESDGSHNSSILVNRFKSTEPKESSKTEYIIKWINDIEVEKADPLSFELSTILGDSGCIPKERGDVVSSTFDLGRCKKITQFFAPKELVIQDSNNSDIIISDSDRSQSFGESLKDVKLNQTEPDGKQNITIKSSEDIADNDVLISGKKSVDKFVKSINLDDNDVINITSSLEEDSINRQLKNIDLNTPSNRWDISTRFKYVTTRKNISQNGGLLSVVSTENKGNKENVMPRKNLDLILRKVTPMPKTEPRPIKPKDITYSERQPKNSCLEIETTELNSLQQNLFKTKEKLSQQSSSVETTKKKCDSESASTDSDKPKKDDFISVDDSSDNEEVIKPVQSLRQDLFKTKAKLCQESSLVDSIKNLSIAISDCESANTSSSDGDEPGKDDSFSDDGEITRPVKGKSRKVIKSPKTEPRSRNFIRRPKDAHSEKKSKTSLLYKNPYLGSEIAKSISLRQDLFEMRTKLTQESSAEKVKQLCDPESDHLSASSVSESDKDDLFSAKESSGDEKVTKPVESNSLGPDLFKTKAKLCQESSLVDSIKNLSIAISDSESANSTSTDGDEPGKDDSFSDDGSSDDGEITKPVKGKSRKVIESPKTEPRPRNIRKPKDVRSEKKSKTPPLYKNPYLESEIAKSISLRQDLFKMRTKLAQESSAEKVKQLCDPESDDLSAISESDKDDLFSAKESSGDEKVTKPVESNSLGQDLFKTKTKCCQESSVVDSIKNLSIAISDSESANSTSTDSDEPGKDDSFSDDGSSDDGEITKPVKGKSRKVIKSPKTEPRPRNFIRKPKDAHSEKKSKTSLLYKNPYLESEIAKSISLRQDLFKMRTKLTQESSLAEKIKQLCDPESDYLSASSVSKSDKDDLFSAEESAGDEKVTKPVERNSLRQNLFKTKAKLCRESSVVDSIKNLSIAISDSESANSTSTDSDEPGKDDSFSDDGSSDDGEITKPVKGKSKKVIKAPKTEPRPRIIISKPKDVRSEKKSKTSLLYKNPYLESEIAKLNSLKQDLFDLRTKSDKENLISTKKSSNNGDIKKTLQDQNLEISEVESILDEAYGDMWRKNRDRILPKTEPRPRHPYKLSEAPLISSERRRETSPKQVTDLYQEIKKQLFEPQTPHTPVPRTPKPKTFSQYYPDYEEPWHFGTRRGILKQSQQKESYTFLESLSDSVPIDKCYLTARKFRNDFKSHKDELRQILHDMYNEKVFANKLCDIKYEWNNKFLSTAGTCKRKRLAQGQVVVTIILSEKVIDAPDRLRDTLIHEMCHAAVFIIDKVNDSHGPYWKSWTAKAMKTFKDLPWIGVCHSYELHHKYVYKCTTCGNKFGRHSKSVNLETHGCGRCGGKFELLINRKCKNGEIKVIPVASTPKRTPSKFALFVKENYATYRSPGVPHGEVMQKLGSLYKESKEG